MAAFAACLVFVVYSGQRIFGTIGPSRAFAAADGRLYLLSHGKIHVFGADGTRERAIDLRALGVHPRPSDFEVHRDGRIVMADPNESVLVRCTPPAGPCERIDVNLLKAPGQVVLPLNPAKLYIDEDAKRYFVSDNSGHRVVVADFSGHVLGVSAPGAVYYPNQLSIVDANELAVVDTGRKRIAVFDVSGNRIGKVLRSIYTNAGGIARAGRYLPFDSVRLPDGSLWVLMARDHMRDGDVVLFDAQGVARSRVDLGADSDPFDLELWRGRVWIADATNYRFVSVTLDGRDLKPIGDPAFAAELVEEREGVDRWRLYRLFAQIGMVAVPLIGLLILWRLGHFTIAPVSKGANPAVLTPAGMMVLRVTLAVVGILVLLAIGWRVFRLL